MFCMFWKIYRLFFPPKTPAEIKEKYNIPDNINLQIKFTEEGWFVITSPELPGLITQGRKGNELLDMLNDAILTYFDVPKREGDIVMNTINIDGYGVIRYSQKEQLQTT